MHTRIPPKEKNRKRYLAPSHRTQTMHNPGRKKESEKKKDISPM
jgi:hypothetical protein